MEISPGFEGSTYEGKVCKLKKALYGQTITEGLIWSIHLGNESTWLSTL